ncbi:MAG: ribulose-phosphate 3-epimerase [Synergistetes bacterium]|nr:ribulose-phosphate 3-epimerase [Synergistota bacterium]
MAVKISASILNADYLNLQREIESVIGSTDWIHVDVMDGHFVPNLTFGWKMVSSIRKRFSNFLDVHIMVEPADRFVETFCNAKPDLLTFHIEATHHAHRLAEYIKSKGIKVGISLNPATPIELLKGIMDYVDLILIMSVNPGFGGQKFIEGSIERVKEVAEMREKRNLNFLIEIDGGISPDNARKVVEAGVDVLVCGSYIFESEDRKNALNTLRGVADGKTE